MVIELVRLDSKSKVTMMTKAKTYSVKCSSSDEFGDCPALAEFSIDENTAREIERLTQLIKKNSLHTVEKFDYRVTWLRTDPAELDDEPSQGKSNEMRTECDILCISNDAFWFRCYLKHCDYLITTQSQSTAELLEHFASEHKAA